MSVEKPKPWQKDESLLVTVLSHGTWYRTEYYADDHLLARHEYNDDGIAWCGRPLVFETVGLRNTKNETLDHRLFESTRTSANARCSECRRFEKEFFKQIEVNQKTRKAAKYAKW
jgi:hypothetical protein